MSIDFVQRVPVGNAVRLILSPPAGATRLRLLRKQSAPASAYDDPAAVVVFNGHPERCINDFDGLVNGTTYHYRPFWLVGLSWVADEAVSATPAAVDGDLSVDVLSIVRERIALGLAVEVASGRLNHARGRIPVLTAPPLYDNMEWPVVTVHVNSDASGERGIGEQVLPDQFDDVDGNWDEFEGWLSRWSIGIHGWCLNPDERIALRKAIKRIVIGNLTVFDAAGMVQIDLQQQDMEDFERYSAPVYQSVGSLTCLAASLDAAPQSAITDVVVAVTTP